VEWSAVEWIVTMTTGGQEWNGEMRAEENLVPFTRGQERERERERSGVTRSGIRLQTQTQDRSVYM